MMYIDEKYLRLRTVECGECWEWIQSYTSSGTPLLPRRNGERAVSVRSQIVKDMLGKSVPKGCIPSTSCENPRCVRPKHVAIITRAQLLERSRRNTNMALKNAKIASTRRAKSGKMTDEIAAEIRDSQETLDVLSRRHRISKAMASKIKRREAWAPQGPFGGMFAGLLAANDGARRRA